jgi:cell division septation protein DedD
MSDEGFHEIELSGKQLVFLFMAATVVAVVIFLCGVMVGRGVPPQRAATVTDAPENAALDPTAAAQQSPALAVASTGTAPITAGETLTYPERLEDPNPPAETLQPAVETTVLAAPPPVAERATATRAAPPKPERTSVAATPAVASPLAEPAGDGFVVQVAAVRQRAEAERIARRLGTKGYPAFVTTAGANFRVRVGKYDNRREAETVAGRLEREEQFKPWITR